MFTPSHNERGINGSSDAAKKVRYALKEDDTGALSTGEAIAVALVLNRPDWLKKRGYTMAQAIEHIHAEGWISVIPQAANALRA